MPLGEPNGKLRQRPTVFGAFHPPLRPKNLQKRIALSGSDLPEQLLPQLGGGHPGVKGVLLVVGGQQFPAAVPEGVQRRGRRVAVRQRLRQLSLIQQVCQQGYSSTSVQTGTLRQLAAIRQ